MKQYKAIDLFAGIGGIRLGFDEAFGHEMETVFVSEWDEHAQKTYAANFGNTLAIAGDITQIDESDIPAFDICLAGFPCQAFSLAGQRKGFTDDYKGMSRGTLFFDVARICALHKPSVIFCENVKGLINHDKGRTFSVIKGTLEELGYTVYEKVLNSRDFGVPQNRERIYIVAFRKDIDSSAFKFPEPTNSAKRIKDIIEQYPVSAKYYLSDVYMETLRRHRKRHEAKGNGFGYEIRDWNDVAGAVVCGGMGRERNLLIDKRQTNLVPVTHIKGSINTEGIRKMTPREWARLQGYPDSFQLPLSDVHLYKQLGNSVSVPVIKAIAEKIRIALNNKCERGEKAMAVKGNRGEWSELYAFFRLLADGKLFAADENRNKIDDMFFPIIKIIRGETLGKTKEYYPGNNVRIKIDGEIIEIPAERFSEEAEKLLRTIQAAKGATLQSVDAENFMEIIHVESLEARSRDKADIIIQIHDIATGYNPEVGFSIKSQLGKPATLLNASKATNFTYEIVGTDDNINYIKENLAEIQGTAFPYGNDKSDGIKSILQKLNKIGCELKFREVDDRFSDNLQMSDSQMPIILAEMLVAYYSGTVKNTMSNLVKHVALSNPLAIKEKRAELFYTHRIKSLLCSFALGMLPTIEWDGTDEASGGYIIVKSDGDVVAYHIYNRDKFKGYLFLNSRFEGPQRFPSPPPSKKKGFDYGYIYLDNGKPYIKLNLQIRFIV